MLNWSEVVDDFETDRLDEYAALAADPESVVDDGPDGFARCGTCSFASCVPRRCPRCGGRIAYS